MVSLRIQSCRPLPATSLVVLAVLCFTGIIHDAVVLVDAAASSSSTYLRSLSDDPPGPPAILLGTARQPPQGSANEKEDNGESKLSLMNRQGFDAEEEAPSSTVISTSTTTTTEINNIMTDETMTEAVQIWCSNPTLAVKYYGPISAWNTTAVTSFRALFRRCKDFNEDISQWDTSKVTSMAAMFEEANAFDQDLSQWDTSQVVSMSAMFADATSFTGTKNGQSLSHWNVEKVTRMDRMFQNAILFQGDLSGWRTLKVHHVQNMFHNAISYEGGHDLAQWYTAEFNDLSGMFHHAIRFRGNISQWNTSSATEMDDMFANAINFHDDLSQWDTSKVITMARMFHNATKYTGHGRNGGIKLWNVENVRNFYGMFEATPVFDADISRWKPSQANNMERMFFNASAFGVTHKLATTVTESSSASTTTTSTTTNSAGQFKLVCWELPNAQVKVQNMFCGSAVRFDPCCATVTQMETSCCNRFCYNTTTTCEHPDQDHGLDSHYHASSESLLHDDQGYKDEQKVDIESHARTNFDAPEKTTLGWEGIVMIVFLILVVMACFMGLVYYL